MAWIFVMYCYCFMTINPPFIHCYSPVKEVSVLFGEILQVIAHRKLVLSLVVVQQIGHKFCLVFKSFATLCCHVPCDTLRMLQTSLLVCSLPSWINALFPHFHHSNLTVGDINIQNLHPKFGRFWHMHTVHEFVLYTWCHRKDLFRVFLKSLKLFFSRLKQNLMQNFNSLKCVNSLGHVNCGTHSTHTHIDASRTKVQCSVKVILPTLIHSSSVVASIYS